ncbi:MAG: chromate reductase [Verrucomicrobiales bacterium]|jgi:chromate reductase
MKKILAFGASTSSASINRKLAVHAAGQVPDAAVTDLDLRRFELPIYSADEEEKNGVPAAAQEFLDLIRAHDGIVLSMAEHNGSYTAAFKNLYDWTSRLEQKVWSGKPMLLLATSPGARGGLTVLEAAKATFPRMGANLIEAFSLPSFYENFDEAEGVKLADLRVALDAAIARFAASVAEV